MLVLTRKVGETLMIGDSITVTILGANRRQIRIGIAAPLDVAVHREEVLERIRAAHGGQPAEPPGPRFP